MLIGVSDLTHGDFLFVYVTLIQQTLV